MSKGFDPYEKFEKFSQRKKGKRYDDDDWGQGKKKPKSFIRENKRTLQEDKDNENDDQED